MSVQIPTGKNKKKSAVKKKVQKLYYRIVIENVIEDINSYFDTAEEFYANTEKYAEFENEMTGKAKWGEEKFAQFFLMYAEAMMGGEKAVFDTLSELDMIWQPDNTVFEISETPFK